MLQARSTRFKSADGTQVGAAAPGLVWTFVAPLLFYLTWQLCYFLVVQVRTSPALCMLARISFMPGVSAEAPFLPGMLTPACGAGALPQVHSGARLPDQLHRPCAPRSQDQQFLEQAGAQGERDATLRHVWCAPPHCWTRC